MVALKNKVIKKEKEVKNIAKKGNEKKNVNKKNETNKSKLLELGLLCDCTGSMASWITRAK